MPATRRTLAILLLVLTVAFAAVLLAAGPFLRPSQPRAATARATGILATGAPGQAQADGTAVDAARATASAAADAADRQARASSAAQLAAGAAMALQANPQRSLLLAIEALSITERAGEPRVPAAEEALRNALARASGIGLGAAQDAPEAERRGVLRARVMEPLRLFWEPFLAWMPARPDTGDPLLNAQRTFAYYVPEGDVAEGEAALDRIERAGTWPACVAAVRTAWERLAPE